MLSPLVVTRSCARELILLLSLAAYAFTPASPPTSPQPDPPCNGGQKSIREAERAKMLEDERHENAIEAVLAVEAALAAMEARIAARAKAEDVQVQ
jgi:hypothetical protein